MRGILVQRPSRVPWRIALVACLGLSCTAPRQSDVHVHGGKGMATTRPEGHLAMPASGRGRPVLLLHPWWGLNQTMKQTCQRLADAGYVVFAPDLYHGAIATEIEDAERLSS